jgi:NAD(P)-dependent dehydrogenase (short-subunit alcohol dehydrogenase family)
MTLQGKTAVVTGGAKGIGHAYCRRLAADGANVVVVNRSDPTESLAELSGPGKKMGLTCDVTQPDQVEAVRRQVIDRFGRCDILVNNAGIFPYTNLQNLTMEVWRKVQATNVESIVLFAMAFVPGMKEAGWGRIVNTGSSIVLTQAKDFLAYLTSKGSVHTLTRALANELGGTGVTVNAIAPSMMATEGVSALGANSEGMSGEQLVGFVTSLQTIQRPSVPDDVANVLAFLVSDDAAFMTGQILHVDGGLTRTGA